MIMMQAHKAEHQQERESSFERSVWDGALFLPTVLFLPRLQLYSTLRDSHQGSEKTRGALDTCSPGHETCKCVTAAFRVEFKLTHRPLDVEMKANFVSFCSI